MPNWCSNELRVSGPPEDLTRFKEQVSGFNPWNIPGPKDKPSPLNFHSLVPVPDHILKLGYANAGHDWEIKSWCARSGACDVDIVDGDADYIIYHFDTSWGPAVPFIENVSKQWPSLTFILDYDEPGNGFKGICKGQGQHFENHSIEY